MIIRCAFCKRRISFEGRPPSSGCMTAPGEDTAQFVTCCRISHLTALTQAGWVHATHDQVRSMTRRTP